MDAGYLWKNTENMMTVVASVISGRGNWVYEVRSGNETYFSSHLLLLLLETCHIRLEKNYLKHHIWRKEVLTNNGNHSFCNLPPIPSLFTWQDSLMFRNKVSGIRWVGRKVQILLGGRREVKKGVQRLTWAADKASWAVDHKGWRTHLWWEPW